jgi:hypothetical protein
LRRLANQPQLGAGAVEHVARRSDLLADLAGFPFGRRDVGGPASATGTTPRAADPGAGLVHRIEKVGQRDEAQRFERPSLNRKRLEHLRQVGRGAKREQRVVVQVTLRLGRPGQQRRNVGCIRGRFQATQAVAPHRRERETSDGLDDPIEFESPKRSRVHK